MGTVKSCDGEMGVRAKGKGGVGGTSVHVDGVVGMFVIFFFLCSSGARRAKLAKRLDRIALACNELK